MGHRPLSAPYFKGHSHVSFGDVFIHPSKFFGAFIFLFDESDRFLVMYGCLGGFWSIGKACEAAVRSQSLRM
jgi:hypothetical protein